MREPCERTIGARFDIGVDLGGFHLDVELDVGPGEVVAMLGPNGAGKSTLLRAVAGLVPLDTGIVVIGGDVLDEPAVDRFVGPERRDIGVVFQEYRLFPTMSALDNVAFGLRARRVPRSAARTAAAEWLDRVGLGEQSAKSPRAMSGGEAQRVALARALVTDPRMLLLDEPLAALDAGTRQFVRRDLRRHLDEFAGMCLVVTHDPVDAHALADRVIVLEGGRVVQQGSLNDITAHPRSRYVADLVGLNVLDVDVRGVVATTRSGVVVTLATAPGDGEALLSIRPQAVAVHRDQPRGSPRNVWRLRVDAIDRHHDRTRLTLTDVAGLNGSDTVGGVSLVAEITTASLDELALERGDQVWASVKATDIVVVSADDHTVV
ncbi:MAG: ABC transporter ATP-binding protein [Actinomycetota bacterium]|nr:ABC transporter ATP-binding protein [Actinomycetota bacterium]